MSRRHFFTSQMAIILAVQLLRFPHLILEHGGGAFLILFFISLHLVALPLMITETVLDRKLKQYDLYSFISMNQPKKHSVLNRLLVFIWFGLRFITLLFFLWFLFYLGAGSFLQMLYFAKSGFGYSGPITDFSEAPNLRMEPWVAFLWCLVPFLIYLNWKKPFIKLSTHFLLPIVFAIILTLFLRVIFSINDFEGLKTLLYPDFSALKKVSPISVIGHTLVSLFIGMGCYNISVIQKPENDPIQVFIQSIVQALLFALLIGIMAVPMIEQVSETAFGPQWVFEIFPRWLSYGDYGDYYCFLFFLTMTFLSFYLTVLVMHLMSQNVNFLFRKMKYFVVRSVFFLIFVVMNFRVLLWLQKNMEGWWAHSLSLKIDFIIVNGLFPLLSLLMIVVVFKYTREKERMEVFSKQQVFYHNRFFFRNWERIAVLLIPTLIIGAWLLAYF